MPQNILITGASGNVGQVILRHLPDQMSHRIYRATRDPEPRDQELFFDFLKPGESQASLRNIDLLFLLRPPAISQVKKYFAPIIEAAVEEKVKHIFFLSVQGAEGTSFIPHARIERLILESGIPYTFFRPSYFMQNLTTTLLDDIRHGRIFLPAGLSPAPSSSRKPTKTAPIPSPAGKY